MSSPIASNHSTFPATEILVSEVPAVLWKFGWKGVTSEAAILKLSLQPGRVYVRSHALSDSKLAGMRKTCN